MAGLRPPRNMSAEFARMFAETRREPVLHEALNTELRAIERNIKDAAAKGDMTCPVSLGHPPLRPRIEAHLKALGYWIETSHYYPHTGAPRRTSYELHWDKQEEGWLMYLLRLLFGEKQKE